MPFRALRYSWLLGLRMLSRLSFDGVLQVFDKLAHDIDRGRLIFDFDGDLTAHNVDPHKTGSIRDRYARKMRLTNSAAKLAVGFRSVVDSTGKA